MKRASETADGRAAPRPALAAAAVQRERGVAVGGGSAAAWLRRQGFLVHPERQQLELFADAMVLPGCALTRVWHTPIELRSRDASGQSRTYLIVKGELEVSKDLLVTTAQAGEAVFADGPGELRLRASRPVAYMEIRTRAQGEPRTTLLTSHRSLSASALSSVAMSSITSDAAVGPSEAVRFQFAVEQLVEGVFATTAAARERPHASQELLAQAMSAIVANASDHHFTVESLSVALNISQAHLRRIMSAAGTSAHAELTAARVRNALRLLASGATPSDSTAHSAGFPSARTMLKHLRSASA